MKNKILSRACFLLVIISAIACSNDCGCFLNSRNVYVTQKQLDDMGLSAPVETQDFFTSKFSDTELKELYHHNEVCPWLFVDVTIYEDTISKIDFKGVLQKNDPYYKQYIKRFIGEKVDFSFIKSNYKDYSFRLPLKNCCKE